MADTALISLVDMSKTEGRKQVTMAARSVEKEMQMDFR